MMKIFVTMVAVALVGSINVAKAQNNEDPTVVFGSAATADGGQNTFVVEQPKGAENPLGDPIVGPNTPPQVFDVPAEMTNQPVQDNANISQPIADPNALSEQNTVAPNSGSNNSLPEEAQELGQDFQNTVTEANGRIYDIQSYPEQDVNVMSNPSDPQTIYSPNVNN